MYQLFRSLKLFVAASVFFASAYAAPKSKIVYKDQAVSPYKSPQKTTPKKYSDKKHKRNPASSDAQKHPQNPELQQILESFYDKAEPSLFSESARQKLCNLLFCSSFLLFDYCASVANIFPQYAPYSFHALIKTYLEGRPIENHPLQVFGFLCLNSALVFPTANIVSRFGTKALEGCANVLRNCFWKK